MYTEQRESSVNYNSNNNRLLRKTPWWKKVIRFIDIESMGISLIALILWIGSTFIKPNKLYFPPNDSNSSFPYEGGSIPFGLVIGIVIGVFEVALLCMFIIQSFFPWVFNKFSFFTAAWGLLFAVSITNVATNVFKSYVGRPRPDIMGRCGGDPQEGPCPSGASESDILSEYKSWPSGHSSTAFSGCFYLALFLIYYPKKKTVIVDFIAGCVVLYSFYVGGTRIIEFRHHPDDVIGGFFVGFLFSYFVFKGIQERIFNYDPYVQNESELLIKQ